VSPSALAMPWHARCALTGHDYTSQLADYVFTSMSLRERAIVGDGGGRACAAIKAGARVHSLSVRC
jgi:hypothetical protein